MIGRLVNGTELAKIELRRDDIPPWAQVEVRQVTPAQAVFAERLLAGDDVATALVPANRRDANIDVTAAFRGLLDSGAFAETL